MIIDLVVSGIFILEIAVGAIDLLLAVWDKERFQPILILLHKGLISLVIFQIAFFVIASVITVCIFS